MNPNQQAPAYIPPSLSGQGVQAYMPSNTNPTPGIYIPPPPDIPAWQQAQHAPLQGGDKRFTFTKPTVDPSFYAQGYPGIQVQQQPPPLPPRYEQPQQTHQSYEQQSQGQYPPHGHTLQQPLPTQDHYSLQQQQQPQQAPAHFGQLGQPVQPLQQQYSQSTLPQTYIQQQGAQFEQYTQNDQQQQTQQQMQSPAQSQSQWQAPAPVQHNYTQQHQEPSQPAFGYAQQQQQWQSVRQPQQAAMEQPYRPVPEQALEAPRPLDHTDITPPNFVNQSSPQSQFVSPITSQHASSFASGHPTSARTDSVSSIALANLHSQREANRTISPKPPSFKNPTPPPPRDDASRFSALGTGGPSDWETLGTGDEVDDEALFVKKAPDHSKPVQLDSVELPAHQPSPPSTQGRSSPANHQAPLDSDDRHDTYQPTPPTTAVSPVLRTPSPRTPQQSFFAKDALVAPLRASPKPLQKYDAPGDARHGFVMGEVLWDGPNSPKHIGNAPRQSQLEGPKVVSGSPQGVQVPPAPLQTPPPIQVPTSHTLAPTVQTPRQTRPGVTRFFSDVGSTWGLSPKDKDQNRASSPWGSKDDIDLPAKLQAKDEELWRLRRESKTEMQRVQAEIEAGKAEFLAEIDRLKADEEAARALAQQQSLQLDQQVETMKTAAEQAKLDADALRKENNLTVERFKEDIEGKEDTIRERDTVITDLRGQLDCLQGQLDNLRKQLEGERTKILPEPPQPTALGLIPDLDPWYAGSLERYIAMLRGEASELQVEDKIKTFKAFLRAESAIRGIEYYDTAPAGSTETVQPADAQSASGAVVEKHDLNVIVPQDSPDDDDYDYSPGGRPVLKSRPTLPLDSDRPQPASFVPSSRSTAILTPTSSVHDDSTPVQSPPDEQSQPQYKAYVPPIMSTDASTSPAQRKATGSSVLPTVTSPIGSGQNHDEIFFGARRPSSTRVGHKPTNSDDSSGVPVVAPLSFTSSRPVSMTALPSGNSAGTLSSLLPSQIKAAASSPLLKEIQSEAATIASDSKNFEELTKSWDKSASLTRRKNDDARRKRAEESEAHNEDLFNSDEISYADLKDLEAEFKAKDIELKNQEDQEEYSSYVEAVFDQVYNNLQADIAALTDLYIKAETLLQTSVSGVKSLGGGDAPTTQACLELLVELHEQIEKTHDQVVHAVAERDKRYKKTEIQPLYAARNIAKMKSVEKHFEQAEREAIHRAKNEKAERMEGLIKVAEEAVIGAASIEQSERSHIIAAIRDLKASDNASDILRRAHEILSLLHDSSKALLTIFNGLEIGLNSAEVDADVAQARVDGAPESKVRELQTGMSAREMELKEEFTRRIGVLDQDLDEFEQLIKEKRGAGENSDELEKKRRLRTALETAKRRNGHA